MCGARKAMKGRQQQLLAKLAGAAAPRAQVSSREVGNRMGMHACMCSLLSQGTGLAIARACGDKRRRHSTVPVLVEVTF